MQFFDSIETYAYGTSKDSVSGKEEIKHSNNFSWWNISRSITSLIFLMLISTELRGCVM